MPYDIDEFYGPDDESEETPNQSRGWLRRFIAWSRNIGYTFGDFRILIEKIFTAIVTNTPPPILLKLHAIFPVLAYFFYGIKELLSFFHTLTEIRRNNYREKLLKAFVEFAAAVLYLLTAASYGSLAFFTIITFSTAAILAAVGTTITWIMLDVLKIGVDERAKQNPVFGFFLVAGMWLFAINALLVPPVALLGISAVAAAGTGCMIISALPIIVTIVKACGRGISAVAKKLYSCCCRDTAVPDPEPEEKKPVPFLRSRASEFMYPSHVSGDKAEPAEEYIYFSPSRRGSLRFYDSHEESKPSKNHKEVNIVYETPKPSRFLSNSAEA